MPRTVAIGIQDFEKIRKNNRFYVDKTGFIRQWWETGDEVTLVTRPRRFGKTLMLNTVGRFLSNRYTEQAQYSKCWTPRKKKLCRTLLPRPTDRERNKPIPGGSRIMVSRRSGSAAMALPFGGRKF